MRVLFSPVGDSDPIRDNYDGSCLHIVRHYKPDAVKLFFTKDMAEKEKRDHRFSRAIRNLMPDIEIISDFTDIEAAHVFDIFMQYVPKSIEEFREQYPDAELLINLSSGTTQLKTTLAVLSVELPDCKGIQVSSPAHGSNRRNRPEQDDIDVDLLIETNLDNEPDAVNRCEEPPLAVLKNFREKSQVRSLIRSRRYGAAWALTSDTTSTISDNTRRLLEYGFRRSKLELKTAKALCTKEERDIFHQVKDEKAERLFEYFLVMQNHASNKEYAELLMKLTPFMYELLKEHIKHNIGCDDFFERCCYIKFKNKIGVPVLNSSKIGEWNRDVLACLNDRFHGFKDSDASFINLYYIISSQPLENITPANNRMLTLLSERKGINVENLNNLRNSLAHNIIMNVSEEKFKEKTGLEPSKLMDILFDVLRTVFPCIAKDSRDSYDRLNAYIDASANEA